MQRNFEPFLTLHFELKQVLNMTNEPLFFPHEKKVRRSGQEFRLPILTPEWARNATLKKVTHSKAHFQTDTPCLGTEVVGWIIPNGY